MGMATDRTQENRGGFSARKREQKKPPKSAQRYTNLRSFATYGEKSTPKWADQLNRIFVSYNEIFHIFASYGEMFVG